MASVHARSDNADICRTLLPIFGSLSKCCTSEHRRLDMYVKRFERSNGLDTALYKHNFFYMVKWSRKVSQWSNIRNHYNVGVESVNMSCGTSAMGAGWIRTVETSPETIEQELQPAVCERRQTT